jgi:hypothetical protein
LFRTHTGTIAVHILHDADKITSQQLQAQLFYPHKNVGKTDFPDNRYRELLQNSLFAGSTYHRPAASKLTQGFRFGQQTGTRFISVTFFGSIMQIFRT